MIALRGGFRTSAHVLPALNYPRFRRDYLAEPLIARVNATFVYVPYKAVILRLPFGFGSSISPTLSKAFYFPSSALNLERLEIEINNADDNTCTLRVASARSNQLCYLPRKTPTPRWFSKTSNNSRELIDSVWPKLHRKNKIKLRKPPFISSRRVGETFSGKTPITVYCVFFWKTVRTSADFNRKTEHFAFTAKEIYRQVMSQIKRTPLDVLA